MWSFVLSVLAAIGVIWLISGRRRTIGYGRGRGRDALTYDRAYDDRVIVEDDRSYRRPFARRGRFF